MKRLWSGVILRQGDETVKRNGWRDFCVIHELVILNTTFQHKDIHKFTWDSKGRGFDVYHRLFHSEKGLKTRSSGCESGKRCRVGK